LRHQDTPEEAAFRAEARAWLEAHARRRDGRSDWSRGPRDHGPEGEAAFFERCRAWQRTLFDGGWAGITWPARYGGRGGTPAQGAIFAEELAGFDATSGFLASTIELVGPTLLRHGSEALRERHLRPLLRGDEIWCQLFSEPEAGSDLAALRTRAERRGDVFVVNGQKLWTTSAQHCDFGILLARTNPELPKHRGITFLLVDMRTPGIEVRPLVTITGSRHFNEVFLTDVPVPTQNVVGSIDEGWLVARTTLASESVMIGTSAQGPDARSLARRAREAGRWPDPLVRQRVAGVYVEERLLGFLADRVRVAVLDGRAPDVDGSLLKVFWAESRARKHHAGLWLEGPEGLLTGADAPEQGFWSTAVLDRGMGTIGGGTVEVHRNGIAERVLGLPRDPQADRNVPFKDLRTTG
jgi:alkylation response protein AidB-like acyl-CoA dehydrogenase